MKVVVQRVGRASVRVGGDVVGEIGAGLLLLLGVAGGDTEADAERLAGKIARLRIFAAADGRFERSLLDTGRAGITAAMASAGRPRRAAGSSAAKEKGAASTARRKAG